MGNIGYQFNKQIFDHLWDEKKNSVYTGIKDKIKKYDVDNLDLQEKLKNITIGTIKEGVKLSIEPFTELGYDKITFQLKYPGLYIGLGYTHDTGMSDYEFKTGFSFHHATGIPYMPASGVKGMLRKHFPMRYDNKDKQQQVYNRMEFTLKQLFTDKKICINKLEFEIFGEDEKSNNSSNASKRTQFGIGVPSVETPNNLKIFSIDTITPHEHPLLEPVPLRTLAIALEVTMDFYFKFKPTSQLNEIEQNELFTHLLSEYGAGAKTSLGYGQALKNGSELITGLDDGYLSFLELPKRINTNYQNDNRDRKHTKDKNYDTKSSFEIRAEQLLEKNKSASTIQPEYYDINIADIKTGMPLKGLIKEKPTSKNIKLYFNFKDVKNKEATLDYYDYETINANTFINVKATQDGTKGLQIKLDKSKK